jgi:hypothetical protein
MNNYMIRTKCAHGVYLETNLKDGTSRALIKGVVMPLSEIPHYNGRRNVVLGRCAPGAYVETNLKTGVSYALIAGKVEKSLDTLLRYEVPLANGNGLGTARIFSAIDREVKMNGAGVNNGKA